MGTAAAVRGQFVLEMIEKLKGDIEGSGMFQILVTHCI